MDGSSGDTACDHYHRWESDLDLMGELGVNAYRFSTSWPRVLPTGSGAPEERGISFYDRLVDGMLARDIAPYLTLYHWDLPQVLEDEGGWTARATAERFAEYAALLGDRLGDRVAAWITLNEPIVTSSLGYAFGVHAPGRWLGQALYPVVHHLLLGHGFLAVEALRSVGVAGTVGVTNNLAPVRAVNPDSSADVEAAAFYDNYRNRQFLDPILLGEQPLDLEQAYPGSDFSVIQDGDAAISRAPIDFLGVNYYNPEAVKAPGPDDPMGFELARIEGVPRSAFDWPVVPEGLTEILVSLDDNYGPALPPIYITENGTSVLDVVDNNCIATDSESPTWIGTCVRWRTRWHKAWISPATSTGPSSTTSNGSRGTPNASGSCTATTTVRNAYPKSRSITFERCSLPSGGTNNPIPRRLTDDQRGCAHPHQRVGGTDHARWWLPVGHHGAGQPRHHGGLLRPTAEPAAPDLPSRFPAAAVRNPRLPSLPA